MNKPPSVATRTAPHNLLQRVPRSSAMEAVKVLAPHAYEWYLTTVAKQQALHQCCIAETRELIQKKEARKSVAVTEHLCWLVMSPERKKKIQVHQENALSQGIVTAEMVTKLGAVRPAQLARQLHGRSDVEKISTVCLQLADGQHFTASHTRADDLSTKELVLLLCNYDVLKVQAMAVVGASGGISASVVGTWGDMLSDELARCRALIYLLCNPTVTPASIRSDSCHRIFQPVRESLDALDVRALETEPRGLRWTLLHSGLPAYAMAVESFDRRLKNIPKRVRKHMADQLLRYASGCASLIHGEQRSTLPVIAKGYQLLVQPHGWPVQIPRANNVCELAAALQCDMKHLVHVANYVQGHLTKHTAYCCQQNQAAACGMQLNLSASKLLGCELLGPVVIMAE